MAYYNRFDVVEANYIFCSDYHNGQSSYLYKRLCRMLKYFSPSPTLNFYSLSENGKEIYENLEERFKFAISLKNGD